jgi:hypothetical protein
MGFVSSMFPVTDIIKNLKKWTRYGIAYMKCVSLRYDEHFNGVMKHSDS